MKKYILTILITAAALLAATQAARGAGYSVKQDGSGDFSTIQACANTVIAGDTCLVGPGAYNEFITFPVNHSGTAAGKITFQAVPRRGAVAQGFDTKNADYLRIEGFEIAPLGIKVNSSHLEIIDNYFHDIHGVAILPAISANGLTAANPAPPKDVIIKGNKFYKVNAGIYIFGSNWLVENNDIERLYRDPFGFGGFDADYMRGFGDYITIKNNHLHGTTMAEASALASKNGAAVSCAVYQDCRDAGFAPDVICDTGVNQCRVVSHTDGFQSYDNNGNWIRHLIYEGNLLEGGYWDGHPFFISARAHGSGFDDDITIRNNIFNPDPGTAQRIISTADSMAPDSVSNVYIYNNVINSAVNNALYVKAGKMYNNIFYNNYSVFGLPSPLVTHANNIVFSTRPDKAAYSYIASNFPDDKINVDPLFVNFAAGDFHLQPSSPGVNAGADLSATGFNYDIAGTPRPQGSAWDIGAYEYARGWYVDNAATSANSGTSWQDAWQSFAAIDWANVQPGEAIYISGGTNGKTYTESLLIGKSGLADKPITIRCGQDAGHNGLVTVIGQINFFPGRAKYIVINGEYNGRQNIEITNPLGDGYSGDGKGDGIYAGGGMGSKILYLYIHDVGITTGHHGIKFYGSSTVPLNVEIAHNRIERVFTDGINFERTPCIGYGDILIHDNFIRQAGDDGIQMGGGVDIYNNDIAIGPGTDPASHPDAIQGTGNYWRIYNNKIRDWGNSLVFLTAFAPSGGHWRIYNNVLGMYEGTGSKWKGNFGIGLQCYTTGYGQPPVENSECVDISVTNNTIYGIWLTGFGLGPRDVANLTIKDLNVSNNIFYNNYWGSSAGTQAYITGNCDSVNFSNNIIAGSNTRISYGGSVYGSAEAFTSAYPDMPNLSGGPQFINYSANDLRLQNNSPAIDAGVSLPGVVDEDILAVSRPQGSGWDIGAYEYVLLAGDLSGNGAITAYDAALALQLGKGALEAAGIAQQAVGLL